MRDNDYLPIEEYGIIGDLRTVALVGSNGSIDWLCTPCLDSESVFAALLDSRKGGRFRIAVRSESHPISTTQKYEKDTNILSTCWIDTGGNTMLRVTDFMPLMGDLNGNGNWSAPGEIHRHIECITDSVEVEVEWSPRFRYAREYTEIRRAEQVFVAETKSSSELKMSMSLIKGAEIREDETGHSILARLVLRKGEQKTIVLCWNGSDTHSEKDMDSQTESERSFRLLEQTRNAWRNWSRRDGSLEAYEWAGPWHSFIRRSALVFKLLISAETGAVAAAATTSLPEVIGGVRNWDYRYLWIRDAAMITQALVSLGHTDDAARIVTWMEKVSQSHENRLDLQVMYGLRGEEQIDEYKLDHFEGYRESSPVRVGNKAAEQFQLETYGELLNAVYELTRRGKEWPENTGVFLSRVADHVVRVWKKPDYGIWEMRSGPFHFTYSKIMAWVALDRAAHLVREYNFPGNADLWTEECEKIRRTVLENGFDSRLNSFTMRFGYSDLDAALLRIPLMEFLPPEDNRVRATVDRIMEHLMENGLVYRYRLNDGLPGKEGAFGLCTFWLVDVLSLMGRLKEAKEIYEGMLSRANRLGLFSEEIDVASGAFLGNFPQAFTHIGVINSALYLSWAQGQPLPDYAPIGTSEHHDIIGRMKKNKGGIHNAGGIQKLAG